MRLLGTAAEMIIGGTAENKELGTEKKDADEQSKEGKKVKAMDEKGGEMKAAAKVSATVVNAVVATDATAAAVAKQPPTAAVTRALVLENEAAKDATETKDSCSGDSGNGADGYDGGGETKTSAAAPTMSSMSMSSASAAVATALDKPSIVAPLSARNKLLERVQGSARGSGRHRRKSSTDSVGSPVDSPVGSSLAGSPADSPFLLSSSESPVVDSPASDCWPSPSGGASIKIALIQHGKVHPNGTPMALPPLASTPPGAAESNTEGNTEVVEAAAPVPVVAVKEEEEKEYEEKKAAENVEEKVEKMAEKAIMMQPMSPAMSPAVTTTVDLGRAGAVAPAAYDSTAVSSSSSSSSSSSRMQARSVPAEEPRAALPHRTFGDDVVGGWLVEQGGVSKMQQHIDGIERAPWVRDEEVDACMCVVCPDQTPFSLFNRRHHCRSCGYVVCGDCSAHRGTVNGYGGAAQRICTGCWEELEMLGGPSLASSAPPSEASMSWKEFEQDFADDSCGCAMM